MRASTMGLNRGKGGDKEAIVYTNIIVLCKSGHY
jgi:hypothetical protein